MLPQILIDGLLFCWFEETEFVANHFWLTIQYGQRQKQIEIEIEQRLPDCFVEDLYLDVEYMYAFFKPNNQKSRWNAEYVQICLHLS